MGDERQGSDAMYIALDTTGLPAKDGWWPAIVSVGVAEIVGGSLYQHTGGLVCQPRRRCEEGRTFRAWEINGIDPEEVINAPTSEAEVASRLRGLATGRLFRGFNTESFLAKLLRNDPWGIYSWGPCVMMQAHQAMNGQKIQQLSEGNHRKRGRPRYPSFSKALSWVMERGHDVDPPLGAKLGAHRKAVQVAKLAVALDKELI